VFRPMHVIVPRRCCDMPGCGSKSKRYVFCVYRNGQYHSRFYRKRDAASAIKEMIKAGDPVEAPKKI